MLFATPSEIVTCDIQRMPLSAFQEAVGRAPLSVLSLERRLNAATNNEIDKVEGPSPHRANS